MVARCLLLLIIITKVKLQTVELPSGKDTCSVVNVNCGGATEQPLAKGGPSFQGTPGKRGPVGPIGPQGLKGDKGHRGYKGEPGESVSVTALRREVLKMFGASNCEELLETGISESGFYPIQSEVHGRIHAVYIYCVLEPGFSTCHQIKERFGTSKSGRYEVKPNTQSSFYQIYCNFTNNEAITTIAHDQMTKVVQTRCETRTCHTWRPKYELNSDQIINVIDNSRNCRQYVKYHCNGVLLFRDNHGHWLSRDGEIMRYWGDATSRRPRYCACGETGTCRNNEFKCNCDSNEMVELVDEGYLNDKTKLPMKELRLGDNGDKGEWAWHIVGALECWG